MKSPHLIIAVMIALLFAAGCGSSMSSVKRDNVAYLYGKGSAALQLRARVHHRDEQHTTLYFKLPTRDLLYKSDGSGGPFRAVVRMRYEVYADWNAKSPIDSMSTVLQDKSEDPTEERELIGSLEVKPGTPRNYVLRVTAHDLNRDARSSVVLQVSRDGEGIRQYFLPQDPRNGLPLFDDHLVAGQRVRVRCDMYKGRALFGSRHSVEDGLPAPVFTSGGTPRASEQSDSLFQVTVDTLEGTFELDLEKPGVYHLQPSAADPQGFSLFVLTQAYPFVGNGPDMLVPLRYITSMQEYDRMAKAPDPRKAVERFWLDASGDRERAREAIRIYYGRVENANRHFSTHVEGWRTDRGLVHIIFGNPNTIYRGEGGETWIFGEENNLMSLTFNFTRRKGPFTDNDLVLQRDPLLKGAWYRNVESWRNGRVYQN